MSISPSQIASLRARTGVGVLAVKAALEEANGDEEKAIEILRKKGQAQAVKKAEREQGEGGIFIASKGSKTALVFVRCETYFVARSDNFVALGQALADHLLKDGDAGLKKFADERIPKAVLEFGENISIGESHLIEAPVMGSYVHSNRKIGVIVGLDGGDASKATDAAMHAAAMNPQVVSPNEISDDAVVKEREIWREQLSKEGKPADIQEKIMAGKEKKFREENAFHSQPFVKDPSPTVEKMLGGAKVTKYVRVSLS
jgi:elongation factor Ts